MNLNLIKILSFFIGLFITLLFISYYKIHESFSVSSQLQDLSEKIAKPLSNPLSLLTELSSMIKKDSNEDDSIIPYDGYKFMSINTYNDINKISLSDGKWYDIDTKNKNYDYNYNNYFKFDTSINLEKNRLNNKNGAMGANIYNIELRGPSCYNFANNTETYELVEFTMFITTNFIACTKTNNILFELTGNTITTDKIIPQYTTSIINVNIILNSNNKTSLYSDEMNCLYSYYTKCEKCNKNPFNGAISFDNIGYAWITIFQIITLENWSPIMYYIQDSHSFWNWIYFVSLILVNN